jgi:protein O-GlcNAc transferase
MLRLISRFFPGLSPRKSSSTDPETQQARHLFQSGQLDQATLLCNKIIVATPENAEAHSLLGGIALQQGRTELAIDSFSQAINIDSQQSRFHQGLGIAYCNHRQFTEAVRCFNKAIALDPRDSAAHSNLGNVYQQAGNFTKASGCYKKALSANPAHLPAYINLADALGKQLKHKAAVKIYRKGLRIAADNPENQTNLVLLHHRLGLTLRKLDKTDEAIACYQKAIAMQPEFALAHNSLGSALLARNELDAAMASFHKALKIEPDYAKVHSNLLMTMNYLSAMTQQQHHEEALKFDSQHARQLMQGREPLRNSKNKKKVLKIGYLSPDFREHSVAFFTRRLFGEHRPEFVEVYCYANVERPDDLTGQFQAQADHWLSITAMEDEEVAAQIRQDGIDILIDLAGHTANNRLLVFARKPAPIQVNWLGYPNTTGMKTMDYRLTDEVADPHGEADRLHSEKLIRLEHGFLCYQADESLSEGSPPPILQQGHITFGSFNTIKKVTLDVVGVWSLILQSIPNARLLMKSNALEDKTTKMNLLQAFSEHGIGQDRIELINAVPHRKDHMKLYSRVDISLDPFPYNGTTTTCEALWMGVPVISMRGNRHAGRVGASILQHAGFPDMIVENEDEYVNLAQSLAGNTERLITLRKALRPQMRESALMDLPQFTKTLEDTYRKIWVAWCNKHN